MAATVPWRCCDGRDGEGKRKTATLERKLPATDMFSEASLHTSFVPAAYRSAPTRR